MIYQEVNLYEFRNAFIKMERDYYSHEGYQALFDWLYDMGRDYELDVVALSDHYVEETFEQIARKYAIEIDDVLDYLADNTCIVYQGENSVLYADNR